MQSTPLQYVVNLFFRRFAVIFLSDFISNCVYTANLENHCIFILVELQRNQSFRYFVTGIELWVDNGYRLPSFFLVFAAKSFFCSLLAALLAQYRLIKRMPLANRTSSLLSSYSNKNR